jgi:hypothetical protein
MNRRLTCRVALGAIALGVTGAAIAADFGATVDSLLARLSPVAFGFGTPTPPLPTSPITALTEKTRSRNSARISLVDSPQGTLHATSQRVSVAIGAVATILHGMSRCDGIHTIQWGTVLATE